MKIKIYSGSTVTKDNTGFNYVVLPYRIIINNDNGKFILYHLHTPKKKQLLSNKSIINLLETLVSWIDLTRFIYTGPSYCSNLFNGDKYELIKEIDSNKFIQGLSTTERDYVMKLFDRLKNLMK